MPLVIDCVPYFNEADLWRLRYETIKDVVDAFVVVEATTTHAGHAKEPSFTPPDGHEVSIARVVVTLPDAETDGIPATRRREMTQRNAIARAVHDINPPDDAIILISDCDEIPNPIFVDVLRREGMGDGDVVVFRQNLCYYDLNTSAGYVWNGTRAARWADVRALSPHVVRYGLGQPDAQYPRYLLASPGGWHLSYFGGADAVRRKMVGFLHQELVTPEALAAVEDRIAAGVDAWGRADGHQFTRAATDDVPPPVLADPVRWRHLYHPELAP